MRKIIQIFVLSFVIFGLSGITFVTVSEAYNSTSNAISQDDDCCKKGRKRKGRRNRSRDDDDNSNSNRNSNSNNNTNSNGNQNSNSNGNRNNNSNK